MTPSARTRDGQRVHTSRTCYSLHCGCTLENPGNIFEPARAYAYARKHLLMVESEVSRTKERLTSFARDSDLDLAAIFIEEIETWPAAFERMLRAVVQDKVEVVILPSLLHFAVLGAPTNVKQYFEAATGARVVTMLDAVSHNLGEAVS